MVAQLQDGPDFTARFQFHFLQGVEVPGIEHKRFFTNNLCAVTQGVANVRIVQVIGRTDRNKIDRLAAAPQFFQVPVEAFEFGKKGSLREITVQDAYRIIGVERCCQGITCGLYGLQMPGGYITGCSDEGEFNDE